MREVTFQDVADFCATDWPEGARLDYKQDIPNDLSKSVAAFANTLGGLVVFGVEVDRATNKPKWPPKGVSDTKGFQERIIQICTTGIHPPIMPTIAVVTDPLDASKSVAVMRVDQSLQAPHAVQNKTQVCIRTADVTKRIDFAEIDRIEAMLRRRTESEQLANSILRTHIDRLNHFVPQLAKDIWAWWR
jgi:predicted HTH transcriptional regulator